MTLLNEDFQYSQSSLQDYQDCQRRFYLRHILHLRWPAVETEPLRAYEEHQLLGEQFHHVIHQSLVGVSDKEIEATLDDEKLELWWTNYKHFPPPALPKNRYPEFTLTAPLGDRRIIAKYDLIAVDVGQKAVIIDWKTAYRRTQRERLASRLQSMIYPYLLVKAGAFLNEGTPFEPEQIEMIYWFAEHPQDPEIFTYDTQKFEADERLLQQWVHEISSKTDETDFPLTEDERRCAFCAYRTLNDRDVEVGDFRDNPDEEGESVEFDGTFSLEHIGEIEF